MALTDSGTNMYMPVAPAYNGNGWGDGFGGDGWWIILFLFAIMGNGWGNGFGGFGGGFGGMYEFPWLLNGQASINANTNAGFQNALLNDNITSVRDGIADLSTQMCNGFGNVATQLCGGFAGVNASINNAQNALAQQLYTNQIADLERSFNAQTASPQGMNAIQSQLAQCCCDNRLATCQTQNIVQNEGNATRFADVNNTRDIMQTISSGNQAILDKLCQLELDGVKQNYENRIAGMQNVIDGLSAQVNASDRRVAIGEEVDALYNRLSNCPVPTTPVYGRTPIFTCNNNNGCGCGGNF